MKPQLLNVLNVDNNDNFIGLLYKTKKIDIVFKLLELERKGH